MSDQTNLLLIFFTGLTTGGLSCVLVQGGLLASIISKKQENGFLPLINFLAAKLVAHIFLGALLGLLGSSIRLSPIAQGWMQIFISVYLVGVAMSLLDVHPFFRHFIITPPRFLGRLVKNQSKSDTWFAPILLGLFTVFIPCGVTQAMEVIALGTGNPLYGAAIMGAFVLGTSPTFFILGFLYEKLQEVFKTSFYKISASLLLIMALITLNGGLGLIGSIYTFQNFVEAAKASSDQKPIAGIDSSIKNNQQEVTINVHSYGYTPNNINLKKGIPTKLILNSVNVQGCARAFTIPKMGISKVLPVNGTETINFVPLTAGPLVFSCSMGMYTGTFNVI